MQVLKEISFTVNFFFKKKKKKEEEEREQKKKKKKEKRVLRSFTQKENSLL